jgi:hypothetical protein
MCAHCGHTLAEHDTLDGRCDAEVEGDDDWNEDGRCPCVDFDW